MRKSSDRGNNASKALRELEAQGLAFTNKAFVGEIIGRDLEKVGLFIEAGINVSEASDGAPPLIWLASSLHGNCAIARLLIDNGADVNAVNDDGVTAIRMAAFNNRKDLVQLLITSGADVNDVDEDGLTLVAKAMNRGQKGMMQLLIANGADVNPELAHSSKFLENPEITDIVERLELIEEKFCITISGLYASCRYHPGTPPKHEVRINFDVTSLSGGQLERNLMVTASAYNAAGQLLDASSVYIDKEGFLGLAPKSILQFLDQAPAKIRLFPSV